MNKYPSLPYSSIQSFFGYGQPAAPPPQMQPNPNYMAPAGLSRKDQRDYENAKAMVAQGNYNPMTPQMATNAIDQQAAAGRQAMPPPSQDDIMRWAMAQAAQGNPNPQQRFRPMPQPSQPQMAIPESGTGYPMMDGAGAAQGGGGGSGSATKNIPTPPIRPDAGQGQGQGALYYLDPGDGGVIRPYFSKDGSAPNYPGMNVFKDDQFDPSKASLLQKIMRGVPFA